MPTRWILPKNKETVDNRQLIVDSYNADLRFGVIRLSLSVFRYDEIYNRKIPLSGFFERRLITGLRDRVFQSGIV